MKEHFCPAEQSTITYQGEFSWCGEREALAQTKEPKIGCVNHDCDKCKAQRTWVGLTDEEIKLMDARLTSNSSFYAGALWAEAKLKEKNT